MSNKDKMSDALKAAADAINTQPANPNQQAQPTFQQPGTVHMNQQSYGHQQQQQSYGHQQQQPYGQQSYDQQQFNHQPHAQQQQQQQNFFNFSGLDDLLPAGMDLNSSGANLGGVIQNFIKIEKDPTTQMRFACSYLTIDTNKYSVALPAIVVFTELDNIVFAHVLLANDRELETRHLLDATRRNIDVITTPTDVYTQEYVNVVKDAIRSHLGRFDTSDIVVSGYGILPQEIDVEDQNQMLRLLWVCATALMTTSRVSTDVNAATFNFDNMLGGNNLKTSMDFTRDCVKDNLGMLHRSDIKIELSRLQRSVNNVQGSTYVAMNSISAFVDLHRVDIRQQMGTTPGMQGVYPGMGMNGAILPTYTPRLVVTHTDTRSNVKTMELMLLALSSANIARFNGNAWKFAFYPDRSIHEHDTRDIGAIGYDSPTSYEEPQWRGLIPTKSAKFDDVKFHQLLDMTVMPNLGFAIDCVLGGENSWLTNVWVMAAMGDVNAIQRIIESCNKLTNGRFNKYYNPQQGNMFSPEIQKLHMGTYLCPRTGQVRDLRDWDELAIFNYLGKNDRQMAEAYGSTFDQCNISEEERLEERLKIIKSVAHQVKVTGYISRVTVNNALIDALSQALGENTQINNTPEIKGYVTEQVIRGQSTLYQYANAGTSNNYYRYGAQNGGYGQQSYQTQFVPYV